MFITFSRILEIISVIFLPEFSIIWKLRKKSRSKMEKKKSLRKINFRLEENPNHRFESRKTLLFSQANNQESYAIWKIHDYFTKSTRNENKADINLPHMKHTLTQINSYPQIS